MKRRAWLLMMSTGVVFCGCRSEQRVQETGAEVPWARMSGNWQRVSGGEVEDAATLRLGWGETLTAVRWAGDMPTPSFELELEARRLDGTDFFCAVTFPARSEEECVTLVIGGWGGALVGISSIDDRDASENETKSLRKFETGTWYRVRLVAAGERIQAWIDDEQVIDIDTTGRKLSLRPGPISETAPFGIATWQSSGEIRNIRWRPVVGAED